MKYLIVLGDGMADKNIPELDNRTPLDYADTPAMDKYSKLSEIGMVRTVMQQEQILLTPGRTEPGRARTGMQLIRKQQRIIC